MRSDLGTVGNVPTLVNLGYRTEPPRGRIRGKLAGSSGAITV